MESKLLKPLMIGASRRTLNLGTRVVTQSFHLLTQGVPLLGQTVINGLSRLSATVHNINNACEKLSKIHSTLIELEDKQKKRRERVYRKRKGCIFLKNMNFKYKINDYFKIRSL